jgi:hypothetical protein
MTNSTATVVTSLKNMQVNPRTGKKKGPKRPKINNHISSSKSGKKDDISQQRNVVGQNVTKPETNFKISGHQRTDGTKASDSKNETVTNRQPMILETNPAKNKDVDTVNNSKNVNHDGKQTECICPVSTSSAPLRQDDVKIVLEVFSQSVTRNLEKAKAKKQKLHGKEADLDIFEKQRAVASAEKETRKYTKRQFVGRQVYLIVNIVIPIMVSTFVAGLLDKSSVTAWIINALASVRSILYSVEWLGSVFSDPW